MNEKTQYLEYLDKYFKLKNKYMKSIKKGKSKCIKCGENGGTLFSSKNNKYTAFCNASNPCGLHLELYRGDFILSMNALYDYKEILEKSKDYIIMLHNDEKFGYSIIDNIRDDFENEKKQYDIVMELFTDLHKCLWDNEEIEKNIIEKSNEINNLIIQWFENVNNYKKTLNIEYLVSIQSIVNDLYPKIIELRKLKYEIFEVEKKTITQSIIHVNDDKESIIKRHTILSSLIQRKVSLDNEEINIKENPAVVKWDL